MYPWWPWLRYTVNSSAMNTLWYIHTPFVTWVWHGEFTLRAFMIFLMRMTSPFAHPAGDPATRVSTLRKGITFSLVVGRHVYDFHASYIYAFYVYIYIYVALSCSSSSSFSSSSSSSSPSFFHIRYEMRTSRKLLGKRKREGNVAKRSDRNSRL